MADTFAARLTRSLDALREARPAISARVASALGARRIGLTVDGEALLLVSAGGRPSVQPREGEVDVTVTTGRRAILALVDGEQDLLDAVRRGRVRVTGDWRDLVALDAALAAYLDGAVRVPALHEHWTSYAAETSDV